MRKINKAGEDLIKKFESLKLKPYLDGGGVLTVGWGHTGKDIDPKKTYTKQECQSLFDKDISYFQNGVQRLVKCDLNDNQFSALVSFVFNVGLGKNAFQYSTFLRKLNAGVPPNIVARDEFPKWKYDNGEVVQGLINRRNAELALFVKEMPDELT